MLLTFFRKATVQAEVFDLLYPWVLLTNFATRARLVYTYVIVYTDSNSETSVYWSALAVMPC